MDSIGVLTLCAVVATLTLVVLAVFVARVLVQVRRTAEQAEATLRRAEPVLTEAELAIREYRELSGRLSALAEQVASRVGGIGLSAERVGQVALSAFGGSIGKAYALWSGAKAGLEVLFRLRGRNQRGTKRKEVPVPPRGDSFSSE
jgi:hypothetical protein